MAKKSPPAVRNTEVSATNYKKFITSLKTKIRSAQIKGAIAVNKELIKLYWDLGKDIVEKQELEGWGSKVLEKVAKTPRPVVVPQAPEAPPRNVEDFGNRFGMAVLAAFFAIVS